MKARHFIFLAVAFFTIQLNPAFAKTLEDKAQSGVVKPKVTTLTLYLASETPRIEEYKIPTGQSVPYGIAVDQKDKVWFTEMSGNNLAVFDPATSLLKEYRIPSTEGLEEVDWKYDPQERSTPDKTVTNYSVGNPGSIIVDKKGMVWFVMQLGNSIVRFDPAKEEFTEFLLSTENAQPYDLAADSKGVIWYIGKNSGKLGYFDIENQKTAEYDIGASAHMMGIAIDKNDKIWFGNVGGNYIGRFDPVTKKLKVHTITVHASQPGKMMFDKNGILWVCNLRAQQLGVLMAEAGVYSVVDLPGWNTVPQSLTVGRYGMIWIVDTMTNQVGYFDPEKLGWSLLSIPTSGSQPMSLTADSKGDIWFTQSDWRANSFSRIVRSTFPEVNTGGHHEKNAAPKKTEATNNITNSLMTLYPYIAVALVALIGAFMFFRRNKSRI